MASFVDGIPDVLAKIAAYKVDEVAALKRERGEATLLSDARAQAPARGFADALRAAPIPALIAEVKKASPSKGVIREDFDSVAIARAYERGGAAALSCLTDGPGFQGSNAIFAAVRGATALPILRKDFFLDTAQVVEARAMGADAVLVILAMVDDAVARDLMDAADEFGMDALVETHDEAEVDRALGLGATLVGVNNRDLRTFDTTLDTFARLSRRIPDSCLRVAESGIFTRVDVERVVGDGAQAILVGESLMRAEDVETATLALVF